MKQNRRLLLVCDVEGTIFKANMKVGDDFASTVWQGLAIELDKISPGAIKAEKETQEKWLRDEYTSYKEWIQASIAIHKKYNLTKEIFDKVINSAEYMPGVKDFFLNDFDREKFLPVFITGGFYELADRARRELRIMDAPIYASCRYEFYDTGRHFIENITSFDFESKIDAVKLIIKDEGLNYNNDWVFIGDGRNDVEIARQAPLSFGINAHPELRDIVTKCVKSFDEIASDIADLSINPAPILAKEKLRKETLEKTRQELAARIEELEKQLESIEKPRSIKHVIPFFENYYGKYVYFGKKAEPSLLKNGQNYTEKQVQNVYEDLKSVYKYALYQWIGLSKEKIPQEVKNTSEATINKYGDDYRRMR